MNRSMAASPFTFCQSFPFLASGELEHFSALSVKFRRYFLFHSLSLFISVDVGNPRAPISFFLSLSVSVARFPSPSKHTSFSIVARWIAARSPQLSVFLFRFLSFIIVSFTCLACLYQQPRVNLISTKPLCLFPAIVDSVGLSLSGTITSEDSHLNFIGKSIMVFLPTISWFHAIVVSDVAMTWTAGCVDATIRCNDAFEGWRRPRSMQNERRK